MESAMTALIKAMRAMLANLKQEQQAIMLRDSQIMQKLLEDRQGILVEMRLHRANMLCRINDLLTLSGMEPKGDEACEEQLDKIIHHYGSENIIVLSLRDQILALAEAIDKQNTRNQLLLDCGKNLIIKPCPWFKPTPKVVIQTLESQSSRE